MMESHQSGVFMTCEPREIYEILDRAERGDGLESAVVQEFVGKMAVVSLGADQQVWDFPMEMLPDGVEVGTPLLIEVVDGRPVAARIDSDSDALAPRGVDQRLARLERVQHLTGHELATP